MPSLEEDRQRLLESLRKLGSCAIAFSGGVDSAVVAKAAALVLGQRAVAVTAVSPSLAAEERELARAVARQIGIRHVELPTAELARPGYVQNAPDRCYHCKTELYTELKRHLPELGVQAIVNGANADDLGDWRPGMRAAAEHEVHSPLAECGIGKARVRELARDWNLPVWDKPASPCLASRIAYGEAVTPQRLAMIEEAERFLAQYGFRPLRVRYHGGDLARIEVPLEALPRLCDEAVRQAICEELRRLGFQFITLDLAGFRSGSLNRLLSLETPPPAPPSPAS
jgi:uncharacterized protein